MKIEGQPVDSELAGIRKSISNNLKNKDSFQSTNEDTAVNTVELKPPIPMRDCVYVFKESSHVAKCSRILADDLIYNTITLTPNVDVPDEHLINQVNKINEYLNKNVDELHNLLIDYNYAGWAALEYIWNNTEFKLHQIPIHTCTVIKVNLQGTEVYLLRQKINSTTKYFKIMGETYPNNFVTYEGQPLSNASLMGGDNIYQFFSLPPWVQNYDEILTEIAIKKSDYKTVSNGNISSGVLNINLEPQTPQPVRFDENGNPIKTKDREEVISEELQSANGGTAVIFTESNRPMNMDYVGLTNNNQSFLSELKTDCQQSVLNDYNIPVVRLMINTEKESMNSNKTQSIWEIYTLNLQNKQKPVKLYIHELLMELYSLDIDVNITTPIFSDRREIEVKLLTDTWNNGGLTLKQYVTGLSEYIDVIDLNDYDFTKYPEIWDYRKIPELSSGLSEDDLALIEEVEAQLNEVKS